MVECSTYEDFVRLVVLTWSARAPNYSVYESSLESFFFLVKKVVSNLDLSFHIELALAVLPSKIRSCQQEGLCH